MNAHDYLSRLRQKNEEKNAPRLNCINPVKDFAQFVQFAPSAKKTVFRAADDKPPDVFPACGRCRHRARPGRAEPGYCTKRTDTAHAYGTAHPLHLLPDDGGASCETFEGWA